jgi:hypothetical protein
MCRPCQSKRNYSTQDYRRLALLYHPALEPSLLAETKTAAENMAAVIDLSGISADGYMVPVWLVLRLGGSYAYYRGANFHGGLGKKSDACGMQHTTTGWLAGC